MTCAGDTIPDFLWAGFVAFFYYNRSRWLCEILSEFAHAQHLSEAKRSQTT
jgi:hypothetical protein